MAEFTLEALKSELENDPLGLGYGTDHSTDAADAAILNNADGQSPRTANQDQVETGDIRGSVTYDAFDGLVTAEQAWFEWLTQNGVIPVNDHLLQQLAGIPTPNQSVWAAAERTEMNAAMAGLMQFEGSRAQELWGKQARVTASDVANARNLP